MSTEKIRISYPGPINFSSPFISRPIQPIPYSTALPRGGSILGSRGNSPEMIGLERRPVSPGVQFQYRSPSKQRPPVALVGASLPQHIPMRQTLPGPMSTSFPVSMPMPMSVSGSIAPNANENVNTGGKVPHKRLSSENIPIDVKIDPLSIQSLRNLERLDS